jgi:hypothetical protein
VCAENSDPDVLVMQTTAIWYRPLHDGRMVPSVVVPARGLPEFWNWLSELFGSLPIVAASRCSGLAGPELGGRNPPDRRERGDVLSVAPRTRERTKRGRWNALRTLGAIPPDHFDIGGDG